MSGSEPRWRAVSESEAGESMRLEDKDSQIRKLFPTLLASLRMAHSLCLDGELRTCMGASV